MVVAVIVTLGYIGFSVSVGVLEANKSKRAAADLIIIQHALEEYKMRFGDYPRELSTYSGVANLEEFLFNALNGRFLPDGTAVNGKPCLNNVALDLATSNFPNLAAANTTAVENHILDPWGSAYQYRYDPKNASWKKFGYVIYSIGPDKLDTAPVDGIIDSGLAENLDNIYAL